MADTAEAVNWYDDSQESEVARQPLVLVVPELDNDIFTRHQANKFMGSVALGHEVTAETSLVEHETDKIISLHDAIHWAAMGNETALKMVNANAFAEAIEIAVKAGIVLEIELAVDEQGNPLQHGQTMPDVHANSLRFASARPQIQKRSMAETRNGFRIKNERQNGLLDDYYLVVWSGAPDDMTKQEMEDENFFVDTMSCAIQATTNSGEGLITQSAFVAGVKELGGEYHAVDTIVKLAAKLGVDYSGKTVTEIIDTPLLIHKSLMPNGVIDLVKLYDEAAGGTFFGQAKPQQDYIEYLEFCKQRERSFAPKIQQIVEDLLAEAPTINSPVQAIKRLHKIAEGYMVEQSIVDRSIDPRVFGPAAFYVEQARIHEELGNADLAQAATKKAKETARSSSCPTAHEKDQQAGGEEGKSKTAKPEAKDSKHGTIHCIKCRKEVKKADVVKPKSWRCPSCKYEVDICNGTVLHKSEPPKEDGGKLTEAVSLEEERREKQPVAETKDEAKELKTDNVVYLQTQAAKLAIAA